MIGLFASLAILGLAAIDPIGIAAMFVLLSQQRPYRRSLSFLGGSFVSLLVMGSLLARGLGGLILRLNKGNTWLVPRLETIAGALLLGLAAYIFWRLRRGEFTAEPPTAISKQLRLGLWHLFVIGAVIVAIQSILDVVFVVAMLHIGQRQLSGADLLAAVSVYAVFALVLQLAVVGTYARTSPRRREALIESLRRSLANYAGQALVVISLAIGVVLLVIGTS